MSDIKTQAQLEELIQNPGMLDDHISGKVSEMVQGHTTEAVKAAVASVLSKHGAKRLPTMDHNPQAPGATEDGKFKGLGDYFQSVWKAGNGRGIDARLMETRNLGIDTGDGGGFTVPEEFRAELLSVGLEQSVIRPRAFNIPMGSNVVRIPTIRDTTHASSVFGGVSASWGSEAEDVSSASNQPAFGQLNLTAHKLTGYSVVSNELVQDSSLAIEALLSRMFGQALGYFEDVAFISGTGAGQPLGILNAPALVTVSKETGQAADTIVKENLDAMYSRILPSSIGNCVWIAHNDTFPQLASLSQAVGTGGGPVWVSNMAGGPPNSIYGRPLIFTEKASTLGDAGDIILADLSYYIVGDRQSLTTSASPHVRFTTMESVFLFSERLDGRPWIESALTPRNGSNTVSPFVTLAARA